MNKNYGKILSYSVVIKEMLKKSKSFINYLKIVIQVYTDMWVQYRELCTVPNDCSSLKILKL